MPNRSAFQRFIRQPNPDLREIPLDTRALIKISALQKTLQWHGTGDGPTRAQQAIRDSFDDALTYFQLIELAIETGYVPEEQIDGSTREALASLCWSEPARRFIHQYEYSTVEALAARLQLGGFANRPLREIDRSGAVHFATFLATHRALERNAACNAWLGLLDDYIFEPNEQNNFYDFLESGQRVKTIRWETLLAGAHTFSVMLADFLDPLPEQLKNRFAGFYQYWLSRMYGFRRGRSGFVRNIEKWGQSDSWVRALRSWFKRRAEGEPKESEEFIASESFAEAIGVITPIWESVRGPPSRPGSVVEQTPVTS